MAGTYRGLFDKMADVVEPSYQEYVGNLVLNRYKETAKTLGELGPVVNIMRPGPYGNPYSHQHQAAIDPQFRVSTREEAVLSYLLELRHSRPEFIKELMGKHLLCCCAPLLCHGHVLAAIANCSDSMAPKALIDSWLTAALVSLLGQQHNYLTESFLSKLDKEYERRDPQWRDSHYAFKV